MKSSNIVVTTTANSMGDRSQVKDMTLDETNKNLPLNQASQAREDEKEKKEQSKGKWAHNPFVLSLIACSNMHDCDEVEQIFQDCQENKSNSLLCEAAKRYHDMCHRDGGKLLDECHYKDF